MKLTAEVRTTLGKQTKTLRKEGLIPAELYGHNVQNLHLAVPARELNKVFKEAGTNTVINLLVGKDEHKVVIHDIGYDQLGKDFTHVDFYQVSLKEVMHAKVPLEFHGEASAVKEKGGLLNKAIFELEVEALPMDLPHRLVVDLSSLDDLNKSIYVRDLAIPKGVKIKVEPETVIVTVTPPRVEEEAAPAVLDVSAVKVETEEKKEKRQAEESSEA